jgi:Ca-activated chloride channel family protein
MRQDAAGKDSEGRAAAPRKEVQMSGERVVPAGFGRSALRELARLVLESLLAGAFVSAVLALAVFIVATQAQASPLPDGPSHGALLLRDAQGANADAPLLFTTVHIDVTGMTARARVTQRFVNPTDEWREGVYLFPLPGQAAVDHLRMQVGARTIEGEIRERGAARQIYAQARQEGRKASLVEQQRPDLFTTRVAHIGPGEEVAVTIEYQEKLAYDEGSFSLRFPMAITPRYTPPEAQARLQPVASRDEPPTARPAAAERDAAERDAAERIHQPLADPAQGAINPVSLELDLDAGFPLARLVSTYHRVTVEERPGHRYHVVLDGPVPAARDFELTYTPEVGAAPGAAFFTETVGGRTYGLLMVLPPRAGAEAAPRAPREVTYVVDTSGSMEGVSMAQAREAMLFALGRLQPGDRFNVIEFNSTTRALFGAPMPVDPATLARAREFVAALHARGGTEMKPALQAAFAPPRTDNLMRQVVFMTDGAVGNEAELLALITQRLQDRRLFTVGIGPAPNAWFMKKAAEAGRGTYTFIGNAGEVKDRMSALVRKLEHPVLTDLHVEWPAAAQSYPVQLPDLYLGEPVVLSARFDHAAVTGEVKLSGRTLAKAWRSAMPLAAGVSQPGIGVLFARDKIEALDDAKRNGANEDDVRRETIAVALAHHLVSAYTSLVAVDVTPTAPAGVQPIASALPGNVPEGLEYEAFAGLPQTATPARFLLLAGALLLAASLAAIAWLQRRRRRAGEPDRWQRLETVTVAARHTC